MSLSLVEYLRHILDECDYLLNQSKGLKKKQFIDFIPIYEIGCFLDRINRINKIILCFNPVNPVNFIL